MKVLLWLMFIVFIVAVWCAAWWGFSLFAGLPVPVWVKWSVGVIWLFVLVSFSYRRFVEFDNEVDL